MPGIPSVHSTTAAEQPDFTKSHLRDAHAYRMSHMRSLGIQGEITSLAFDPIFSLMAVGTSTGLVHLLGAPPVQCTIPLSSSVNTSAHQSIAAAQFLTFVPGSGRLCCIDSKNTLHVWNTGPGGMDDIRNQPVKEITNR